MDTKAKIETALKTVMDPELGVNIFDLGLIYGIDIEDKNVVVTMTMTSAACPMHNLMSQLADNAVYEALDEKYEVEIKVVFEPAWTPDLMSAAARDILN
ncbi:MAG: metal-sulfur cluster assembly factor [bacterium]|nr:metal-sulfur cluster assembly factor [bacterium]